MSCFVPTGYATLQCRTGLPSPQPPARQSLPACLAANRRAHLSRLQVYAASIMFGYFLRRVDKRFQLAKQVRLAAGRASCCLSSRMQRC